MYDVSAYRVVLLQSKQSIFTVPMSSAAPFFQIACCLLRRINSAHRFRDTANVLFCIGSNEVGEHNPVSAIAARSELLILIAFEKKRKNMALLTRRCRKIFIPCSTCRCRIMFTPCSTCTCRTKYSCVRTTVQASCTKVVRCSCKKYASFDGQKSATSNQNAKEHRHFYRKAAG